MSARNSVPNWDHLRVVVGVAAVNLLAGSVRLVHGMLVKAAAANTGVIYVGKSDVTAGGTAATDGYPLAAGEEVFIPADSSALMYAIASAADQNVTIAYA